ncbi:MAG: type III-B CRISPR module RAMP protein Cmr1 [Deltaproteobacteria bacterium]|nr:type III-B CRISPR module RAMP protein Cmr1 [Deltaproteobacteria bacterium]
MENRKTLTVTLETVTPLFLGGAEAQDRNKSPELRPPAFRGALRYWLRAALGGVIGDNNLDGLHRLERVVFGSTDYGSPIHLRLRSLLPLQSGDEKILPHKEGPQAGRRKAFKAGQKEVELVMHQLRSAEETVWQAACSALNLALTFGGVGLRSRRGYGTLHVRQSSDSTLIPLTPKVLEGWRQHVKGVAEKAVASAHELADTRNVPVVDLPEGPARYPCATRLGLIRLCDMKAASAMVAVMQFMQKVQKTKALGDINPRQASPLWVRPIQLGEQYGLLLTVLASNFNGANYNTVRNFLDEKFAGEDVSVKGWNA